MSKYCNKCKTTKDLSEFYFRRDENRYETQCKRCNYDYRNKYKRDNDEYKKRFNEYRKQKRLTDVNYAMKDRLRARLRKLLKAQNVDKYEKTLELLGCSMEVFKAHIESKFYGDMSWDKKNFELDHVIPLSWFDLSSEKQRRFCFNYKNR